MGLYNYFHGQWFVAFVKKAKKINHSKIKSIYIKMWDCTILIKQFPSLVILRGNHLQIQEQIKYDWRINNKPVTAQYDMHNECKAFNIAWLM